MKKTILLSLIALFPIMANSAVLVNPTSPYIEIMIDGLRYMLNKNSKTAELCYRACLSGPCTEPHTYVGEKYSGDIVIPETVEYEGETYTVTSIGHGAFENCPKGLESLTIPATITHISGIAFASVFPKYAIKKLYLPSLEWWLSLDMDDHIWENGYGNLETGNVSNSPLAQSDQIFFGGEEWDGSNLIIPEGITEIGRNLFRNCKQLSRVTLPSTLNSIGDMAFCESGLTSITIPCKVEKIGSYAFALCKELSDIDFQLPSSLVTIAERAFRKSGLKSVILPESVRTIGYDAFSLCQQLRKFDMGDGISKMEDYAFNSCLHIKFFCIGKNFTFPVYSPESVTQYSFGINPDTIVSRIEHPLSTDNFYFDPEVFAESILYVPVGKCDAYATTGSWKKFKNITDGQQTSVQHIEARKEKNESLLYPSKICDIQGRILKDLPVHGFYIKGRKKYVK